MTETPSEKTQAKAAELLLTGHVKVRQVALLTFQADVHSMTQDGDPYRVRFTATGWHCDCPARVMLCSHILACQTITDFEANAAPDTFKIGNSDPTVDEILGSL